MSKFKVGDRVKFRTLNSNDVVERGTKLSGVIIEDVQFSGEFSIQPDNAKYASGVPIIRSSSLLTKLEETMSQYDVLRGRIEVNRSAELGWGKEFDDILVEINSDHIITIPAFFTSGWRGWINVCAALTSAGKVGETLKRKTLATFFYESQCEKNTALHDAALWLLDHSDIKKDEKADKIKELKSEIKALEVRVKELE